MARKEQDALDLVSLNEAATHWLSMKRRRGIAAPD